MNHEVGVVQHPMTKNDTTLKQHRPVILVVDDEPMNLHVLVEGLNESYDVRVATSGEGALSAIASTIPDLILLDIMMPNMNGYEVIEKLKSNSSTQHIPVIFVTAMTDDVSEEKGFELGAVDYIHKPYKLPVVRARVRTHLSVQGMMDRLVEKNLILAEKLTEIKNLANQLSCREAKLREALTNNKLISQALMSTAEGVLISDKNGKVDAVNASFCRIMQYSEMQIRDLHVSQLFGYADQEKNYNTIWQHICQHGHYNGELTNRKQNGQLFPCLLSISAVYDEHDEVSHLIALMSDISHIKVSQARIDYLTWHDVLTNLPNRHHFLDKLACVVDECKTHHEFAALLVVDVDGFKKVNDAKGLKVGDDVLVEIAKRLAGQLHPDDTLARLGADEFGIIMNRDRAASITDCAMKASQLCDHLMKAVSDTYLVDNQAFHFTISVGVLTFPHDHNVENIEDMLRQAEVANHIAKENGGHCVVFYDLDIGKEVQRQFTIEQDLRRAVMQRDFKVMIQPQYDAEHNLVGGEALIRWEPKGIDAITTEEFIKVAENAHLISQIDRWMLLQVVKVLSDNPVDNLRLSVNISGLHFYDESFLHYVKQTLSDHNVSPSRLTIEITESTLIEDDQNAVKALNFLKNLGVRVSVDDFGTGYSCLAYLKKLPIQELKIDKSFVMDAPSDQNDRTIMEMIVNLGQKFDLEVVAEGVELQDHVTLFANYPDVILQGFFFDRPLTLEQWKSCCSSHKHH